MEEFQKTLMVQYCPDTWDKTYGIKNEKLLAYLFSEASNLRNDVMRGISVWDRFSSRRWLLGWLVEVRRSDDSV